jgi:predicted  nucleic acid-binding Zn-ribbon protein
VHQLENQAMNNKRINPIVADRDDMIGRSIPESKADKPAAKKANGGNAGAGMSGLWKFMVLVVFFGLAGGAGFGWLQYQDLATKHNSLQQRFELLESRLSSTDESVTQSGAAMQLNISKQGDELKKHWSEIRKLWGVTNDINKGKIEKNKQDISFLASKRNALEATVAKDAKSLSALSANYLSISADIDAVNGSLAAQTDGLNRLKASLTRMDRDLKNNAEAVQSMEAFRRQINQKIYALEQRIAQPAPIPNPTAPVQ